MFNEGLYCGKTALDVPAFLRFVAYEIGVTLRTAVNRVRPFITAMALFLPLNNHIYLKLAIS